MKKLFKNKKSPITTVITLAAIALIAIGGIGGTRSALTYFSEVYAGHVEMYDIGVSLLENGEIQSYRNYVPNSNSSWSEATGYLLGETDDQIHGEKLEFGKSYTEELSVQNTGTIDQYVRVNVYRYWVDEDGNKLPELDPALIDLHFTNVGSAWLEDTGARTAERNVFYYSQCLGAGQQSAAFADELTVYVDDTMVRSVTETTAEGKIVTTYDYDGVKFVIEAEVDAIQDHNAQDAALSAWGTNVFISGNSVSIH